MLPFVAGQILQCGKTVLSCRMLSTILGCYPLELRSNNPTPQVVTPRCDCGAKCPLGNHLLPTTSPPAWGKYWCWLWEVGQATVALVFDFRGGEHKCLVRNRQNKSHHCHQHNTDKLHQTSKAAKSSVMFSGSFTEGQSLYASVISLSVSNPMRR